MQAATLADLARSGLTPATILAAGIRDADDPIAKQYLEKAGIEGYLIPYYDAKGNQTSHIRVKLLPARGEAKYWQPPKTGQHVYLPPPRLVRGWIDNQRVPLLITEGEKKALAACQAGLPTLGLGGIWSWRRKQWVLDKGQLRPGAQENQVVYFLNGKEYVDTIIAPELQDVAWYAREVTIIFDSPTSEDIDEAAFELADWLEEQGAIVWRYVLPNINDDEKIGLDDYLAEGNELTWNMIEADRMIPTPANTKRWISRRLEEKRLVRGVALRVGKVAHAALDQWGAFYSDDAHHYYFDADTKILHRFELDPTKWRESTFGTLLFSELGLGTADITLTSRLADEIKRDEAPIEARRVLAPTSGTIYYQITDGRVARVSARGIDFVDNGTDDVLFLADSVEPLDEDELQDALAEQPQGRWFEMLDKFQLEPLAGLDRESTVELLATLFYISPWLNRWRGLMPPLEIAVAEPGSGKTGLYNLRKGILTGRPQLSGLPDDYRTWAASVSNAGPLWVCDNLGGQHGDYWHRLTDDLARMITDPRPTIELRKLYTTEAVTRLPVYTIPAITTIRNPLTQPDLLQRAILIQLNAIPTEQRDPNWYERQLAQRPIWVAEHLNAIQRFLALASKQWKPNLVGGYRLPHVEQALTLMGKVFGVDLREAVGQLVSATATNVAQYDPVVEGLLTFVREYAGKGRRIRIQDVIEWVQDDEEQRFSAIRTFRNSIVLGRYIGSHKYDIEQATGLKIEKVGSNTHLRFPD